MHMYAYRSHKLQSWHCVKLARRCGWNDVVVPLGSCSRASEARQGWGGICGGAFRFLGASPTSFEDSRLHFHDFAGATDAHLLA